MRMRLLALTAFFIVLALAFQLQPNEQRLSALVAQKYLLEQNSNIPKEIGQVTIKWDIEDLELAENTIRTSFKIPGNVPIKKESNTFIAQINKDGKGITEIIVPEKLPAPGPWSLLPALIAIFMAFITRRTLTSLATGIVVGAFIATYKNGIDILGAIKLIFYDILYIDILNDAFNVEILAFVLLLSSTVALITRNGGIEGLVQSLLKFAKNSRSVQAIAYFLGLGIFFDDYTNTIVVGNSCGPLFDKQKISRAKLAYIVDSTAAPVAGIAVLSTWVAYQISTYAPQLPTIGLAESQGYALFLETVPYRFYCLFAIFLVGIVIFLQRDFGPMWEVEKKAKEINASSRDDSALDLKRIEPKHGVIPKAFNAWLPLTTMIFGTAYLIYYLGAIETQKEIEEGLLSAITASQAGGFEYFRTVLGNSDSTFAIFLGSSAAFLLAIFLSLRPGYLTKKEVVKVTTSGIRVLFKDAVMVLVLAWSIGEICQAVGTAHFLVACFQDIMSPLWLPIILFLTSCLVAFATGSSWTTMAILQPNVVLLAYQLGEQTEIGGYALLILSIGSVLEGAIFGDHCSPISDTTVLSSTASHCRHIEHVRTQAPYALLAALIAISCAYLPVALFGVSPFLCIGAGFFLLMISIRTIGKKHTETA